MSEAWINQTYKWRENQVLNNNFLFLHIHKTGGSSVKSFLGLNDEVASHQKASSIINEIGIEEFKKYTTFCVIRNPFDLVVSYYHNRIKIGTLEKSTSFSKFILNSGEYSFKKICNQFDYISYKGEIVCDYILRYETLIEDLENFLDKTDLKTKLKKDINDFTHKRKSKRKHFTKYYNKKLIHEVEKYYSKDLEFFHYTFDQSQNKESQHTFFQKLIRNFT